MAARISDITGKKESRKKITDCGICSKNMEDPRMLDCFHTFCLKCLKGNKQKSRAGDYINCPVCSKVFTIPSGGLDKVPVNDFVSKLLKVDKYPSKGNGTIEDRAKVLCDQCLFVDQKESAIKYCVDCNEHLCDICSRKHKMARSSSDHKIYTLEEKPSVDELLKIIVNDCQDHPKNPLALYCRDCKTLGCVICIRVEHEGHKCLAIKAAAVELGQNLYEHIGMWSRYKNETDDFVKTIDKTVNDFGVQITKARSGLKNRYEEMKVLLEKHYKELNQDLDRIESERKRDLERMRDEGKQEMLMLESLERHWNEVKARGSDCDVVQAAVSLQNRSEQIVKQHEDQMSQDRVKRSQIDFNTVEYEPADTFTINDGKNILGVMREMNADGSLLSDWKRLLNNSHVQSFTSEESCPLYIAIHNNEVYMANSQTPHILVYSLQNLSTVSRQISVPGLTSARGLVYNESDSCLYASNYIPGHIYKINTRDNSVTGWATQTGETRGLSISKQKNLLVSYESCGQIDEFNGSAQLIRSIKLSDGITGIFHSIELETGEFIVCQSDPLHRICLVNSSGKVIKSYGKEKGTGVGQLYFPMHVELDQRGNILVSDNCNNKLRVLTSDLKYVADVNITDTWFQYPTCTCWDKENDRLIVTIMSKSNCFYAITPQTL